LGLKFFPLHRSGSGFVQSGFYEVALTPAIGSTLCHATSQNPPDSLKWQLLILSFQLSREDGMGKSYSMDLRERVVAAIEGGMPSISVLRHSDTSTFDALSKARYLEFLGNKINAAPPTAGAEKQDPAAADAFCARCGDWLRENTRNTKKFNILFNENVTYGFRRNLLGLKWPALGPNLFVVVLSLWFLYRGSVPLQDIEHLNGRILVVFVVAVIHALYI
jgi:hypothetical protein